MLGTSAALCWGVGDVAIALLARRAPSVTVAIVVQGASVVMLVAWRLLGPGALTIACAVGWLDSAGFLLFNRGAEIGQAAITSAAAAAYPLLPIACGLLLLHECLRAYQAVGVAGVLAGMTLLAL